MNEFRHEVIDDLHEAAELLMAAIDADRDATLLQFLQDEDRAYWIEKGRPIPTAADANRAHEQLRAAWERYARDVSWAELALNHDREGGA